MGSLKLYHHFSNFVLIAVIWLVFAIGTSHAQSSALSDSRSSDDTVLVKFVPGTSANLNSQAHAQAGGRVERVIPGIDVAVVKVARGSVDTAIQIYQRNSNVIYAERNYKRLAFRPTSNEGTESPTAQITFDNFNEQWNLHNIGQAFGLTAIPGIFGTSTLVYPSYQAYIGADINAPEAWAVPLGTNDATIAVLDTGVDCNHLDLVGKCLPPHSVVTEHEVTLDDFFGHGSHVAGIAAASTNNGIGIAGVAPGANIAPIKTCYQDAVSVPGYIVGTCEDDDSAEAILYAVDQGYQVINMSFAGPDPTITLQSAIDQAWLAGVVLVAAAGNNYTAQKQYPAAYSNVIGVGSTDYVDNLSGFSTFSQLPDDWISVLAPGTTIVSTVPGKFCGQLAGDPSDCYDTKSGTSMASPHVAGLAALMFNHFSQPDHVTVRQVIESSAVATGTLGQNMLAWSAHGRIDMVAALNALDDTNPPPPPPPPPPPTGSIIVESIQLSTVSAGRGDKFLQATVTVKDNLNNPLPNLTVSGTFSGNFDDESVSALDPTDVNGVATLQSVQTTVRGGSASFGFCVTLISPAGALEYTSEDCVSQ